MKTLNTKKLIILIFVPILCLILFVYLHLKAHNTGREKLQTSFHNRLENSLSDREFDVVILYGNNLDALKNSFAKNIKVIEHIPEQQMEMLKLQKDLQDKSFVIIWSIADTYRLPQMTKTYRLFFKQHQKTLYAPFEMQSNKRFPWQNEYNLKVQYYLYKKPDPIDFNKATTIKQ